MQRRQNNRKRIRVRAWIVALIATPIFLIVAFAVIIGLDWRQEQLDAGLIAAIEDHQTTPALRLLKQGASPNAAKQRVTQPTVQALLQHLWNRLRGMPVTQPSKGLTALLLAVQADETPVVEEMLDRGVRDLHVHDGEDRTLIRIAMENENHKLMRDLWQHHAAEREDLLSLLLVAVEGKDQSMAATLLAQGAPVQGEAEQAYSPFYAAAVIGDWRMMQFLLDHGASVDDNGDNNDYATALSLAASKNDFKMVRFLIAHGASINEDVRFGSALTKAVDNGHIGMVRLLLAHGADPNLGPYDADLPVVAAENEDMEILKLLLKAGADPNVNLKGGPTLLGIVASDGDMDAVNAVLAAGAHINGRGADGTTALMNAAEAGQLATVRLLLRHGANINMRGYLNHDENAPADTALDLAIKKRHSDVARLLRHSGELRASELH